MNNRISTEKKKEIILSNKIRCKKCGEIIESFSVHDYRTCKCRTCAVDGGHEYIRRSFSTDTPDKAFEELSEVINSSLNI